MGPYELLGFWLVCTVLSYWTVRREFWSYEFQRKHWSQADRIILLSVSCLTGPLIIPLWFLFVFAERVSDYLPEIWERLKMFKCIFSFVYSLFNKIFNVISEEWTYLKKQHASW